MESKLALADMILDHVRQLPFGERMVYAQKLLFGSPYGWGDEVIGSADCSGAVSFGLWLNGYRIRTTATGLFDLTDPVEGLPDPGDLAFWANKPNKGGMQHVSMFSDHMLIIDSSLKFYDTPLTFLQKVYFKDGREPMFRRFNPSELNRASEGGEAAWGVDPRLDEVFGVFKP